MPTPLKRISPGDSPPPSPPAPAEPGKVLSALITSYKQSATVKARSSTVGKCRYPYFTATAANEIADILDTVIATKQPQFWKSAVLQYSTLKAKWYQGLRYLLEHMDEDGEYARLLNDDIGWRPIPGAGIRIFPKSPQAGKSVLQPLDLQWKDDFQDFLNTAQPGSTFERITAVTPEEQQWLMGILNSPDLRPFISHNQPCDSRVIVTILP